MFSCNCTEQKLTVASSLRTKTKPNLRMKQAIFLAHSALPPQHKFQKTMHHLRFYGPLTYPHLNQIPE